MISFRNIIKELDDDYDYTTAEIIKMGFKRFSVFNAINKGELMGRKIFGKMYVNGTELKEYLLKAIRKS